MKVAEADSEQEAAMICGLLESNGIEARYDNHGVYQPGVPWLGFSGLAGLGGTGLGRQEIVVRAPDADRAARILAQHR